MVDVTLERLAAGIKAANAKGDKAAVQKLGQAYRQLQAQQTQTPKPTEARNGAFEGFGQAFKQGVDQPLENMGTTAEAMGFKGTGEVLKGATEQVDGYESASSKFMNGDFLGFDPSYLPKAIVEQAGQFAGSLASRAAGAAVGSVAGPGGTAVGAFTGPAVFEGIQILGPTAIERAKNNGREAPNSEDWAAAFATASASGALNAIAPGAQGALKRMLLEGGTEGVQSVVQQTGETAATDAGLSIDPKQAVGEGIIGAGSAGAVDASIEATKAIAKAPVKAVQGVADYVSRTDDIEVTDDHVRLAERLRDATSGDLERLADVSSTDAEQGAQSYAKAVLGDLRAEAAKIATDLSALARKQGNREAEIAISRVLRNGSNLKSTITQENIDSIKSYFPDQADADRLTSLTNQIKLVTPYTNARADMGGLSRFTGFLDVTDQRGRGIGGAALGVGALVNPVGLKAAAAGVALNRSAQFVDRLTNRRSRIKRFVDSVDKKSTDMTDIQGPTARDSLQALKDLAKEAQRTNSEKLAQGRAAEKEFLRQEKQDLADIRRAELRQMKQASKAPSQVIPKASPLDQSKADLYRTNNAATAEMFDTGVIPTDNPNPIFQGYTKWNQATGLSPSDVLDTLEQLEREGSVPSGTSQRFREDIYSFKKDKMVPAIQEQVRQRANPDHKPQFSDTTAEKALRKLDAASVKPSGSRRKQKAKEGERRAQNVVAEIEGGINALPAPTYRTLHKLKESIDRPDMTAEMRGQLVDETLSTLFQGPILDHWNKVFTPLVTIGNDYVIERKVEQEAEQEQNFETKVEKVKEKAAKKRSKKPAEEVTKPVQLELDLIPTEKTVDRALEKLASPTPKPEEPTEVSSEADQAEQAQEPAPLDQSKAGNKNSLSGMINDRVSNIENMLTLASERGEELASYMDSLPPTVEGRVERLILDLATDQVTVNMVADAFADRFDVPPVDSANLVFKVLSSWQDAGKVKLFRQYKNDRLKVGGEYQKDESGKYLDVLSIEVVDEGLAEALKVAKSVNYAAKMVNQDQPDVEYTPYQLSEGPHKALKDYDREQVDDSFRPILDFLNAMRQMKHSVHPNILTQIEDALSKADPKRLGTIADVLRPVVKEETVKSRSGKLSKKKTRDEGPMKTVAQLLFQLGRKDERTDTRIRQEWSAGRNLRIYSKNGVAHAQSGDIMKGMLRTDQKYKVGSKSGLKFMFHSFGNLLGHDKQSPLVRREAIFQPGVVDSLIAFADDPFGRNTLVSSRGNETPIAKLLKGGEGFFQVLNVAHEVKSMMAFAKARNKTPGLTDPADLLRDPAVQADLAKNYETDFIVQLDASNNAYQLAGLVMGYQDVLQATGLQPRPGITDPDSSAGADIYLDPGKAVASRIPELANLGLPDSKIRKIFKKAIGTYLYAAEFNSRKESFRKELQAIADGAPIFGSNGESLIEIPPNVREGLLGDGFTFQEEHFNVEGDVKETIPKVRRIIEKNGVFYVATSKNGNKETVGNTKYESKEEAIQSILENDLYARMNREMIRDFETRYPGVRDYLNFANKVSEIARDKGQTTIKVPTPDGIMLEYAFKESGVYTSVDLPMPDGKVVRLGVKTPNVKITGRGLAAFMTHQLDAYVLRETYRRMREKGIKSFNPIHDSFGFHPSDAEMGQKVALEVMQELGSKDFNLFTMILQANGWIADFQAAGGQVPDRQAVNPMPAKRIPTALS